MNNTHCWLEVDSNKINNNIHVIKNILSSRAMLGAVIKSNAYGYGISPVAKILQKSDVVCWAISYLLSEAIFARKSGFKKNILVCGYVDADIEEAVLLDIDLVVYDDLSMQRCAQVAKKLNKFINIHIKVDTGLTRLGFNPEDVLSCLKKASVCKFLNVRGLFSHFAESDAQNAEYVEYQKGLFNNLLSQISRAGFSIPIIHLANTVAAFRFSSTHNSLVRVGGGIYGLCKKIDSTMPDSYQNLQPAITWKSRVMQVKKIPSGTYVGYGRTFRASHNMKIAVVPVGYADGYSRKLSNNSFVFINGKLAKLVGNVCMNMIMVDVTGINVEVNDEVILLGDVDGIRISDFMNRLNTISYEVTNMINWTIPRVIV